MMPTAVTLREAADWLSTREDVAVLCHQSPDGDTLGSAAALVRALHKCGKRAALFCADTIAPRFSFLFDGIEKQAFEPKTVVAVDVADEALLGKLRAQYEGKIELCIDHHPSNRHYAGRYFEDANAAATCELLVEFLPMLGVPLDRAMAIDLYTGLATDTGCFQYVNVTPKTLRTGAQLLELGVPAPQINHAMFGTKSRARLSLEALAIEKIEYFHDGEIAVAPVTLEMRRQTNATDDDTDGVASIPRSIEGVRIGITLKEKAEDLVKVSLRCPPPYNASEICAQFGGGGHPGAAGCALHCGLEEAKQKLVAAAAQYLEAHA